MTFLEHCEPPTSCQAAPVVAQPIQDLSAVSITHKTVGIRLPRLWCGAVGLSLARLRITKTGSSSFPFVHGGVWVGA
jgi:hypothetical protein